MKNVQSCVNRFGFRLTVGQIVKFHIPRGKGPEVGTIKEFNFTSIFAKAYGAQVRFADNPHRCTIDDCFAV